MQKKYTKKYTKKYAKKYTKKIYVKCKIPNSVEQTRSCSNKIVSEIRK